MSTAPVVTTPAIQLRNILFATDFSESSRRALRYAETLAEKFGARICLCHAMTPTALAIGAPESAPYLYEAEYEGSQRDLANLLRVEEEKDLNIDSVLEAGPLKDVLMNAIAKKKIDLVIAVHSRSYGGESPPARFFSRRNLSLRFLSSLNCGTVAGARQIKSSSGGFSCLPICLRKA